MMTLSSNSMPRFVFLNGWGMSSTIFEQWITTCRTFFPTLDIITPTLNYCESPEETIVNLLQQYQINATHPVIVIGWSLGGLFAQQWASSFPETIKGLVLCATTPCFVEKAAWTAGISPLVFQKFVHDLQIEPEKTRQTFLFLQAKGDRSAKLMLQKLKQLPSCFETACLEYLKQGLYWLGAMDTRLLVKKIAVPTYLIHGQNDALMPVAASHYLAENIAGSCHVSWIPECGHVPFWDETACYTLTAHLFEYFQLPSIRQ